MRVCRCGARLENRPARENRLEKKIVPPADTEILVGQFDTARIASLNATNGRFREVIRSFIVRKVLIQTAKLQKSTI